MNWTKNKHQFKVCYQPIVCLTTGQISGFEALLRWQHPTQGYVSPVDFIPIAEDTGLIVPLGNWVLQTAIHQMSIWQQNFPYQLQKAKIAINLSGKQLLQTNLIEQIENILQAAKLDSSYLKLEITESLLMENYDCAIFTLKKLSQLGVGLSIDDFGTGYSSLGRLQSLPVNSLKIDRCFIRQMDCSTEKSEIVRAIVTLAHSLKINVVVEGIETAKQLDLVRSLNCHQAQGFYFAKPQDHNAIVTLLTKKLPWIHHFSDVNGDITN
ncbi:EAL domain-containing protein [Pleurocapsales cyanobacterium LEGE 10410]|nr:EAL domain-containing protein [Pleurocapsales cyanobacterium LEGE 10410]